MDETMRSTVPKDRMLQCDLRTALGPGTQAIGVTEAILRVVACKRYDSADPWPRQYCDTRNTVLDRARRRVA